jgi:hypothetical protein
MPAGPHTACMPVDAPLLISAASPANESRDELRRAGFTDEIDGWARGPPSGCWPPRSWPYGTADEPCPSTVSGDPPRSNLMHASSMIGG